MKTRCLTLLAIILLLGGIAFSQNAPEKAAANAAEKWLALADAGDYSASWSEAAQFFKNSVTKSQWVQMMNASRTPLGKTLSRKLKAARYTTTLPGAPDGQYVVIQYDTSFANKRSAVETVTPMLDQDGQWRVSGYFIR
jgi:hypothetical protein